MKARLVNDSGRSPGWSRLELVFDNYEPRRPSDGETFTVAVQRLPEQSYLQAPGGDRWPRGGAEHYLKADSQTWDGRMLLLELGPDFTSALAQVPCLFTLKGSLGTTFERIRVDTKILKALPADHKIVIDPDTLKQRQEEEARVIELEKEARQRAKMDAERLENTPLAEPVLPIAPPEETGQKEPVKKQYKFLILAFVLLFIALMALAVYFLMNRDEGATEKYTQEANEQETAEIAPPSGAEPSSQGAASGPKAEVAELFRRNASYQELENALARLEGQEGAEDAVFLLLTELAPLKPALQSRLAAFFDPSDPRPSGSIIKNALTAYDEYEAAKQAGDAEAAAAQARLLKWAEGNAASDPAASELLNR